VTWKTLRHPNVLPLLGVTMSTNHLAMVSEWMINGNINEFIQAHRDANRFELVGLALFLTSLLADMAPIAQRCR
jgi:serine/threonine protein kinase